MPKRKAETQTTKEDCPICMQSVKQWASIDGCSHKTCLKCIKKWGKDHANTCPTCRAEFTKITCGKRTVKVKPKRQRAEVDDPQLEEFLIHSVVRFIRCDTFKERIKNYYTQEPSPMVELICRTIRFCVNNDDFIDCMSDLEGFEVGLERAQVAIELIYRTPIELE